MNFALSSLNGMFTKITHTNITDEEAEELLDAAVIQAADEIRTYARQARATEKHLQSIRQANTAEQEATGKANRDYLEQERVAGLRRQEELCAAEAKNGPRRGGTWN
ncbi:MAG: hypothetical protein A2075_23375 [Geobacteraceae bacterium GWC2_58_44]|nr:MAG: hypothetical protein A2075_23375 [Geobacteraceae bacterium GWC2_58_44]